MHNTKNEEMMKWKTLGKGAPLKRNIEVRFLVKF